MKHIFTFKKWASALAIAGAVILITTGCHSKQKESKNTAVLSAVDSADYEQFQAWKDKQAEKALNNQRTSSVTHKTTSKTSQSTAASVPVASARKKGWSSTAKGAVIGGVGGAVIGGVVNKKNRVAGAVIGGVTGAATGVIIGHTIDKKQGRR